MTPVPKSVQLNYARGSVSLMLWFMHRKTSEGVPFKTALADYADIYRKTAFFNLKDPEETKRLKPEWEKVVEKLAAVFDAAPKPKGPHSPVEGKGLELLGPHLAARVERGLPLVDYQDHADFGCFYYQPLGGVIDLHFTNTIIPESPFKDAAKLSRDLRALVADARKKHPSAKRIKCGSWLNAYPPFRALFPDSWKDSGEPKSFNSLGWWGQFARHDGDFHARNAERFRATERFPYACTFHQCALDELEAHLAETADSR